MSLKKQTLVPLGLSISSLLLEIGGFAYSSGLASAAQILASGSAIAERFQTLRDSHSLSENITRQLVEHGKAYFSEVSLPNNEIESCVADVCAVVDGLKAEREDLFQAVKDRSSFLRHLQESASSFRATQSERSEPFFDSLVSLAGAEILAFAEESDFFKVDALLELLERAAKDREIIVNINDTLTHLLEAFKTFADSHALSVSPDNEAASNPSYRVGVRMGRTKNFVSRGLLLRLREEIFQRVPGACGHFVV